MFLAFLYGCIFVLYVGAGTVVGLRDLNQKNRGDNDSPHSKVYRIHPCPLQRD